MSTSPMLSFLNKVVSLMKIGFHWGFLPLVLYLGFSQGAEPGMPELTLSQLLWA